MRSFTLLLTYTLVTLMFCENHRLHLILSYSLGVRIVSNSWGSIDTYEYTQECTHVDKFVWENNDMTIVFAAGNDGEKGFNTVGSPGLAKNCISVGASNGHYVAPDQFDYISYFSSRGNRYSKRYELWNSIN